MAKNNVFLNLNNNCLWHEWNDQFAGKSTVINFENGL